ncbi:DNA/RNA non-specific endonuclease [Magnetovibrio sp.]|uniref:DNA/RNA non-specific endonuclease n=1 Tax=Magnetovibrio sp. TaxID=2024836 RepID=UPI002F94A727
MKHIVWLTFAAAIIASVPANAANGFDTCGAMFPGGVIPAPRSQTVLDLCKHSEGEALFAIRFDTTRKIPNWTVHRLTPEQMAQITANSGTSKRPKFTPDTDIPADDQAVDKSYVRSGYARGHIVPANDMSWRKDAYDATFHFSNVVPQKQTFNAGTWLGEEDAFRAFVAAKNVPMWVFSGVYGTVEDDPATTDVKEGPIIGTAPFTPNVPKCFYKIVVARPAPDGPYKVLASLFRWNDYGKRTTWVNAVTPLETVEARSGIDFLAGLDVESDFDAAYWGVETPNTPGDCP